MQLILFSKMFADRGPAALVSLAQSLGVDGYDLCVRPGHPVETADVGAALPRVVGQLRAEDVAVPMVTCEGDLVSPEHPSAEPIVAAMDKADVRLMKLGYFQFDPAKDRFAAVLDNARRALGGWEKLGRKYDVKICHHTHCDMLGSTAAGALLLVNGLEPKYIGVKVDPRHLAVEGEPFAAAAAMVRDYLSIVSLKDAGMAKGKRDGHGCKVHSTVEAGQGWVDWTVVRQTLVDVGFDGPMSIHCEFELDAGGFDDAVAREVKFFRQWLAGFEAAGRGEDDS